MMRPVSAVLVAALVLPLHAVAAEGTPSAPAASAASVSAAPKAEEKPAARDPLAAPDDVAAPPASANVTPSGLATRVLVPGTGAKKPGPHDRVTVHYTGWTTDGKRFDSSVERGEPATFPLDLVIPGWAETVQLMVEGETRRTWIPEALAYKGRPGAPAGMLVFDVELRKIVPAADPTAAPPDVAAAPKDAEVEPSGLASKVVRKGNGKRHPTASSRVTVHYTGWTPDGKMFDSSRTRGEPTTFGLDQVIPGWTEGLQLMVTGEVRRFWIPGRLAYDGIGGSGPRGMLVFEVELLRFEN